MSDVFASATRTPARTVRSADLWHSAVAGRRRAAALGVLLAPTYRPITGGVRPDAATKPIDQTMTLDVPGPRTWSPPA